MCHVCWLPLRRNKVYMLLFGGLLYLERSDGIIFVLSTCLLTIWRDVRFLCDRAYSIMQYTVALKSGIMKSKPDWVTRLCTYKPHLLRSKKVCHRFFSQKTIVHLQFCINVVIITSSSNLNFRYLL